MQIITQPEVHVLSSPMFTPHPKYKLPPMGTPSEQLMAHAGKGCYDSYGEDGRSIHDHIRRLVDSEHGAVVEHANVSLFVSGISRGVSHEWVRHRAGFAYSQRSTRYVNEGDCAIVLEPYLAHIYENPDTATGEEKAILANFIESTSESIQYYREMVDHLLEEAEHILEGESPVAKRKWARGKARQLLPIGIETRMTVTANFRAWRHFLYMRSSRFAETEIRRVAQLVFDAIQPLAPIIFEDFEPVMIDGFPEYTTSLPKV